MPRQPPRDLVGSAEAGDPEAQCDLGRWYIERAGDSEAGEAWFRRAAEQGLARAKHNLGVLATQTEQMEVALDWFRAAVQDGWLPSVKAMAALHERGGHSELAFELYEILARRGDVDAQDSLGRIALELDNENAYVTALHWSEAAAAQGSASAQARLGTIYHEGLGVERDPPRAAAWFLSAARLGHAGAQLMIGGFFHLGVGVEADRVEAAFWLSKCVAQNELAEGMLRRAQAQLTPAEAARVRERLQED